MKTELKKFNAKNYYHGKNVFIRGIWLLFNRFVLSSSIPYPSAIKVFLLRCFGAKIGKAVVIKPRVHIKHPWHLTIKDYAWIGEGVWIDNLTYVLIGSNVCISQGAYLCTGNHDFKKNSFDLITRGIVLEDGVWIGAFSKVGPGVHAGEHSILTLGSTLTHSMDANGIYQGNPAKFKSKREIQQ